MRKEAGPAETIQSDAVDATGRSGKYGTGQPEVTTSTQHSRQQWKLARKVEANGNTAMEGNGLHRQESKRLARFQLRLGGQRIRGDRPWQASIAADWGARDISRFSDSIQPTQRLGFSGFC